MEQRFALPVIAALALTVLFGSPPTPAIADVPKPGTLITVAGTGAAGFSGDGGPATKAHVVNPEGVFVDALGNLVITDTGNSRVLRYGSDGSFIQRVDVERDARGQALVEPIAVTADSSLVFVGDRTLREVIRYRRRQ